MEKSLKRQLVNAAEAVKKKVQRMRNIECDSERVLENVFKPITDPLNQMVEKNKLKSHHKLKEDYEFKYDSPNETYMNKTLKTRKSDDSSTKAIMSDEEQSTPNTDGSDIDDHFESQDISNASFKTVGSAPASPNQNVSSWSLSSEFYEDAPYGVRNDRGKLIMGTARVTLNDEYITVGENKYKNTAGLKELLFKKNPNMNLISNEDTQAYKAMLEDTNAHRRDYDPKKPIKSNKGRKYLNIIKPLFKLRKDSESSVPHGTGLPLMKTWKKNVDYIYWDNPNELVERLKLLLASRDAGNTGLDNEIVSILEELREGGIIK